MSQIAISPRQHNRMGAAARRLRANMAGGGRALMARVMQNLGEPRQASGARRIAETQARSQPRYRIGDGAGLWLSLDGRSTTTNRLAAWFGTADQAEAALNRFPAAKALRAIRTLENRLPARSNLLVL